MARSRAGYGAALVVVLSSCGELPRSPWVLDEAPRVLAIRIDVALPGPLGEDLSPVPPGRMRAEVLPGDVIRPRALAVTVDGEIDLDATEAAWLLCRFECPYAWEDDLPRCEDVAPGEVPICLAGRGASPEFLVPGEIATTSWILDGVWMSLAVITGLETREDTDTCIERMQSREDASVQDCGIGVRRISYGPDWKILEELTALDGEPPFENPVPVEIAELLPPNAAPELSRVQLFPSGEIHDLSETLRLPAGATIAMRPDPDPVDLQLVFEPVPDVPNAYVGTFESIDLWFYTTEEVAIPGTLYVPGPEVRFVVPDEPTSMTLWLIATDHRGARSWTRTELQVTGP